MIRGVSIGLLIRVALYRFYSSVLVGFSSGQTERDDLSIYPFLHVAMRERWHSMLFYSTHMYGNTKYSLVSGGGFGREMGTGHGTI